MKERRRLPRTTVDYTGKVLVGPETIIECSVRNVTGLGICIFLKRAFDNLPTELDFSFDNFKTLRRCDVSYRHDYEERIDGYHVTYAYNGREYTTDMPYDPGERIRVRVDVAPAE